MSSSKEQIISQFITVRSLNTTAYMFGWVTEQEFTDAQNKTWYEYAEKLSEGGDFGIVQAKIDLLRAELEVEMKKKDEDVDKWVNEHIDIEWFL